MPQFECLNCLSGNIILDEYTALVDLPHLHFAQYHCADCGTPLREKTAVYAYDGELDAYVMVGSEHGELEEYPVRDLPRGE